MLMSGKEGVGEDAHTNTDTMSPLLSRLPGFPLTGNPHNLWAQTEQLPCTLYVCSSSPAHPPCSRSGHFLSCLDHYTGAPAETQPLRRFSKPLAAWPVCPPRIALFSFPTDSGALPFPPDRPTCISQFESFPPSGTPVPSPVLQRPVRMLPLPGSRLCLTPASPQTARSSPFLECCDTYSILPYVLCPATNSPTLFDPYVVQT